MTPSTSLMSCASPARTALIWASGYGLARAAWLAAGRPGELSPIGHDLVVAGWWSVVLCAVAGLLALALMRRSPGPWEGRFVLAASGVTVVALAGISAIIVLDVIGGLFPGLGVDFFALGAVSRVACLATAVLLALAARAYHRRTGVGSSLSARVAALTTPLPETPSWAWWAAYISMTACLVRVGAQLVVGLEDSPLSSGAAVVMFEICFVLAGTVLPLALVHRWGRTWPRWVLGLAGRPVPRRLVLWPGAGVAGAIVVYFGMILSQMVAERLQGRNPFPPDEQAGLPETFFWVAVPAYVVWGAALGYHRRTRSREGRDSLGSGMDPAPRTARLEA